MIFEALQAANRERNAIWDPKQKLTPLFFATELAGEVGEACNIVKKLEREVLGIKGSRSSRIDLGNELADIVICTCLLANAYNINNLAAIIVEKFNQTSRNIGLPVVLSND